MNVLDHPFSSGAATIKDHALYWELHGNKDGGTVTLLHHGLGSIRSWRRQTSALIEAGWQVLVYDRWGYGRSDIRGAFDEDFLLKDATEAFRLMDILGISRSALIGHSDGGTIALLMAAMQPERVAKLIVIAAHIYYEPKMRAGLLSIAEQTKRPPLSIALKREHGDRADHLTTSWINHWLNGDPTGLDMSDRLEQITCPTLVIQGELDEHATAQHALDIATGVRQGHSWLIPEVGHMPPHEIPEEFNRRVLDFLAAEPL